MMEGGFLHVGEGVVLVWRLMMAVDTFVTL